MRNLEVYVDEALVFRDSLQKPVAFEFNSDVIIVKAGDTPESILEEFEAPYKQREIIRQEKYRLHSEAMEKAYPALGSFFRDWIDKREKEPDCIWDRTALIVIASNAERIAATLRTRENLQKFLKLSHADQEEVLPTDPGQSGSSDQSAFNLAYASMP